MQGIISQVYCFYLVCVMFMIDKNEAEKFQIQHSYPQARAEKCNGLNSIRVGAKNFPCILFGFILSNIRNLQNNSAKKMTSVVLLMQSIFSSKENFFYSTIDSGTLRDKKMFF